MSRAVIILTWPTDRERAHRWVDQAPVNARVEFKAPKRTLNQNAKMWAMLTDIASQVKASVMVRGKWSSARRSTDWWKLFFLALLGHEREQARDPTDHSTVVSFDRSSSSDLGRDEMSDLIELMYALGARANVEWSEPGLREARITHVEP